MLLTINQLGFLIGVTFRGDPCSRHLSGRLILGKSIQKLICRCRVIEAHFDLGVSIRDLLSSRVDRRVPRVSLV